MPGTVGPWTTGGSFPRHKSHIDRRGSDDQTPATLPPRRPTQSRPRDKPKGRASSSEILRATKGGIASASSGETQVRPSILLRCFRARQGPSGHRAEISAHEIG